MYWNYGHGIKIDRGLSSEFLKNMEGLATGARRQGLLGCPLGGNPQLR
jgi:hypothetical protein